MNKVILMGRLTRDPEVRYGGANNTQYARFSIAVDRRFKRDGQPTADFFNCTAFGKQADFVERYLKKGTKILLDGELQNDNYTNRDGQQVYGFRVITNQIEFAESKNASGGGSYMPASDDGYAPASGGYSAGNNMGQSSSQRNTTSSPDAGDSFDGFMNIPDGIEEELPFS